MQSQSKRLSKLIEANVIECNLMKPKMKISDPLIALQLLFRSQAVPCSIASDTWTVLDGKDEYKLQSSLPGSWHQFNTMSQYSISGSWHQFNTMHAAVFNIGVMTPVQHHACCNIQYRGPDTSSTPCMLQYSILGSWHQFKTVYISEFRARVLTP